MRGLKVLGFIFILMSFAIISANIILTGAVIGTFHTNIPSIIALAFFVAGIILFEEAKEGNLAARILKSGAIITDPKKIEKIARRMGYDEIRFVKEGRQILHDGRPLTVIPHHPLSAGVYRSIMKSLSSGEPSFRRYAS
jgi:hypothetical protein